MSPTSPDAEYDWWAEFLHELTRPDEKCDCGHGLEDSHYRVWGSLACYWCDCGHAGKPEFPEDLPAHFHEAWANVVWGVLPLHLPEFDDF